MKSIYQFLSDLEELIRHILSDINSLFKEKVAGVKGLEPSTYRVTGDRSNQLSYTPQTIWYWNGTSLKFAVTKTLPS